MLDPKSLSVLAQDLAKTAADAKAALPSLQLKTAQVLAHFIRCANRDLKKALAARCDGRIDKGAEARLRGRVGAARQLLPTAA